MKIFFILLTLFAGGCFAGGLEFVEYSETKGISAASFSKISNGAELKESLGKRVSDCCVAENINFDGGKKLYYL